MKNLGYLKVFQISEHIMKAITKIKSESTTKTYSTRTRNTKKDDQEEKLECKIDEIEDVKPDLSSFKFEKKKTMKRDHKTIELDKPETKEIKSETVKIEKDLFKKGKWVPENWEQVLVNLREMRKDHNAPVDKMGCDKCMDESAPDQVTHIYYINHGLEFTTVFYLR